MYNNAVVWAYKTPAYIRDSRRTLTGWEGSPQQQTSPPSIKPSTQHHHRLRPDPCPLQKDTTFEVSNTANTVIRRDTKQPYFRNYHQCASANGTHTYIRIFIYSDREGGGGDKDTNKTVQCRIKERGRTKHKTCCCLCTNTIFNTTVRGSRVFNTTRWWLMPVERSQSWPSWCTAVDRPAAVVLKSA